MIGYDWMVWMYLYVVYVCMYRMTNCKLEVRIFLFKRTIQLLVEITRPMLISLNYRLKLLKRQWYTYTSHVNPLTYRNALPSIAFYRTPHYFLCNVYYHSRWVNEVFIKFICSEDQPGQQWHYEMIQWKSIFLFNLELLPSGMVKSTFIDLTF